MNYCVIHLNIYGLELDLFLFLFLLIRFKNCKKYLDTTFIIIRIGLKRVFLYTIIY